MIALSVIVVALYVVALLVYVQMVDGCSMCGHDFDPASDRCYYCGWIRGVETEEE